MKNLRRYIRQILEGLKFDQFDNLALYEGMWSGDKHYVLFDITLIEELNHLEQTDVYELGKTTKHLYGLLSVEDASSFGSPCNYAGVVNFARARNGWGPTMYDIVMGMHPNGLIADRDSVSPAAFDVWKFYKEKRPDIEKSPLDHESYGWTLESDDDCYPGSDGDYLPKTNWKRHKPEHKHFLEDPLSWSYNRGPVPGLDQLRENWYSFEAMADERYLELNHDFWIKLSRGFFGGQGN
jgi:hypothetical protein